MENLFTNLLDNSSSLRVVLKKNKSGKFPFLGLNNWIHGFRDSVLVRKLYACYYGIQKQGKSNIY